MIIKLTNNVLAEKYVFIVTLNFIVILFSICKRIYLTWKELIKLVVKRSWFFVLFHPFISLVYLFYSVVYSEQGIFLLFYACDWRTHEAAFFQNIFKCCTFLPRIGPGVYTYSWLTFQFIIYNILHLIFPH